MTIYFLGSNIATGVSGLYETEANVGDVKLVAATTGGQLWTDLYDLDGTLYFTQTDSNNNSLSASLWKSDGTASGTVIVSALQPEHTADTYPGHNGTYASLNGTLYFSALDTQFPIYDTATGETTAGSEQLAESSGSAATTKFVDPGSALSVPIGPSELTTLNGSLYFVGGIDPSLYPPYFQFQTALFTSNGSAAPVMLTNPAGGLVYPSIIGAFNGVLYFEAISPGDYGYGYGGELWRTNGTALGTYRLTNLGQTNFHFVDVNGTTFFVAVDASSAAGGNVQGSTVYVTDGTQAGTQPLFTLPDWIFLPTNVNGTLFFVEENTDNPLTISKLWKSDGTVGGAVLVKALPLGDSISAMVVLGNTLYFFNGMSLWKSDGTDQGTTLVTDLTKSGYVVSGVTTIDGELFFNLVSSHVDSPYINQLWKSDGTSAGTVMIENTVASDGVLVGDFMTAAQYVQYFIARAVKADDKNGTGTVPDVTIAKDALSQIITTRELNARNSSTNIPLRDAEYWMRGFIGGNEENTSVLTGVGGFFQTGIDIVRTDVTLGQGLTNVFDINDIANRFSPISTAIYNALKTYGPTAAIKAINDSGLPGTTPGGYDANLSGWTLGFNGLSLQESADAFSEHSTDTTVINQFASTNAGQLLQPLVDNLPVSMAYVSPIGDTVIGAGKAAIFDVQKVYHNVFTWWDPAPAKVYSFATSGNNTFTGILIPTSATTSPVTITIDGFAPFTVTPGVAFDLTTLVPAGVLSLNIAGDFGSSANPGFGFTFSQENQETLIVEAQAVAVGDVVNPAPLATDGSASGHQANGVVTGTVLAGEIGQTTDQLSYALVGTNGGATHGTVALNTHGTFTYTAAAGYLGSDSFSFKANGGLQDSNVATEHLSFSPNVLSVVATGPGIVAGTGQLGIDQTVTLTVNTSEAVFVEGGTPILMLDDGGNATYVSGSGTAALVFTSKIVIGQNSSDLQVIAVDLGGATIRDAAGNDADLTGAVVNPAGTLVIGTPGPALLSVAATSTFAQGGSAVQLSPSLSVTDAANTSLVSATVAVTGGVFIGDGDILSAATTGTSIAASYSSTTETLALTGTDTLAHYQTVLRSVTFTTPSQDPTHAGANPTRTVTWTANDGTAASSAVATTVQVKPLPTLSVSNDPSATKAHQIPLSTLVTISDPSAVGYQTLELYDTNGVATAGQFMVGGVAQTGGHEIDVSPANVAGVVFDVGTLGGSDTLYARLLQNNGQLTAWQPFTVTAPLDQVPVVSAANVTATHGQASVAASSLFRVMDGDGDTITTYALYDATGSGHFVVGGVTQGAAVEIDLTAAQLASAAYQFGAATDQLYVRANDGALWGNWQPFTTSPFADHAPVVTAPNATATHNQSFAASNLFTVSDADGDTMTTYAFYDATGNGHFVVNGVTQRTGVEIDLTAAQLAQTVYQSGSGSDQLYVRANDGTLWSAWQPFTVTAPADHAPVASALNVTAVHGQASAAASNLFTVTDTDGDTIATYALYDATGSGHFVVGGVTQGTAAEIDLTAAQLASTAYQFGAATDQLYIRANDGALWGTWQPFTASPFADHAPVVSASNLATAHNQSLAASSLFTVSDADGDTITTYAFYDATGNGHFAVGGVTKPSSTEIDLTAAQLAQTVYQSGSGGDQLYIRANDGTLWSSWQLFTVTASVNQAPVVTASNTAVASGHSVAASLLFAASDPNGDTITTYALYDATGSGHFVVNGVTKSAGTEIDLTAAQLAQTIYVAGSATDQLYARANDGALWGNWQPFMAGPVPPVVTAANTAIAAGHSVAASSLFTASDPDGGTLTTYALYDATGSGHFVVNGVTKSSGTEIDLTAAQLAQTTYVAGAATDKLYARANDGVAWSSWQPFMAGPVPPVVAAANTAIASGHSVTASSLFTASDPDGGTVTTYALYDATGSGHFVVGGVTKPAGTEIDLTTAQLAQTTYVAGSTTDQLYARANDGAAWSSWQPFMAGPVPPVVTAANLLTATGQVFAASSLFTSSDPDGGTLTTYALHDATGSGHFAVNGVTQASGTEIDLTAAQLAQTTYVAGAGTDQLYARANNGTAWSAWQPFTATGEAPAIINAGATLELAGAYAGSVTFFGTIGTLKLDNPASFTGTVAGMTGTDSIDFTNVNFNTIQTLGFVGTGSGGALTVTDGTNTDHIALLGNYLASTFVPFSDGHGGTSVIDPPAANQNNPLAQSQHG